MAEEVKHGLEEQCKELVGKSNTSDREMAQVKQEMNAQTEELRVKVSCMCVLRYIGSRPPCGLVLTLVLTTNVS